MHIEDVEGRGFSLRGQFGRALGQVAQIVVYNGDGQNSTFASLNSPPTYSYPNNGTPQIQKLSLTSLPAGATGMVDITTQNTAFVDGQVTVGFGSSDITVQRVFVLGPTHLEANISVGADAVAGSSEVSVISGFAVLSQDDTFQVLPRNPSLPVISAVANANNAQQTIYPGVFASIYGVNLANSPCNSTAAASYVIASLKNNAPCAAKSSSEVKSPPTARAIARSFIARSPTPFSAPRA